MATHNIFFGGNRTKTTFPPSMLPSADVLEDQIFEADNRRGPIDFSLTRRFVFKCHDGINKGCPNDAFSAALAQWWDCLEEDLADGDILQSHIMPRRSSLREIEIWVTTPVAGMTVDIQVRGNADSVGGTQVIEAGVDLGTEGGTLITLPDPIYFDQNDMLQLVLNGVPANLEDLRCANFEISPVVREYCRGYN